MADDDNASVRYLQKRVEELERRNTQLEVARKEAKREAVALKAERDAIKQEYETKAKEQEAEWAAAETKFAELAAERDEFRGKAEAPPDERITQLEQQLKTLHLKAKFRDIEPLLAEGFDLETAWATQKFDPAKVEDIEKFDASELAKEWRASRPGLFKPEGSGSTPAQTRATKPPLTVGDGAAGRGARDSASGQVTYKRADIRPPDWMSKNRQLAEAIKDGTAVLVDD